MSNENNVVNFTGGPAPADEQQESAEVMQDYQDDEGQTMSEEPASKYWRITDDEFLKLAAYVIQDCHGHLVEMKIIWLMRAGEWKAGGHDISGKAKLISAEDKAAIGEGDFKIIVNESLWQNANAEQRIAILDHLLCYCDFKENEMSGARVPKISRPDIQEFTAVISRRGLYSKQMERVNAAMQQMPLFGAEKKALN